MNKDLNVNADQNSTSPLISIRDGSLKIQLKNLRALLNHRRAFTFALLLILFVAAGLRFYGLNWDSGTHLHPDERFLSSTTNDLKWPKNFNDYFDPTTSTLSPYSLPDMGLYVYGTLPVYIVKWVAILLNSNDYDKLTYVGRVFSGLFDLGAVLLLFLIGRKLYGRAVALLAAMLLAFSVLNIQLSHFYAVDTYANLFIVATIYFLLRGVTDSRLFDYAMTGLMFGLGLASKISVFTLAVPILVAIGLDYYRRSRKTDWHAALEPTLVRFFTVILLAALTFRVLQPIAFAGPGFWNWSLNPRWLRDIADQQNTVSGNADLPWVQQWTGRSIMFPVYNIVVWGLGLPLGLASLAGFGLAVFELVRHKKIEHLLPVVYVAATFTYHAVTFIKFMRYFLPLYPFLALFAAYLILWLWRTSQAAQRNPALETASSSRRIDCWISRIRLTQPIAIGISVFVIGGTVAYAFAFTSIYSRPNSRVTASRWIFQNIPAGSTLANEHWDDWLPIGGVDGKQSYGDGGLYQSVEMANYDDDTPDKLDKMIANLSSADYVILSSNRLYDSIPRLPMRYPMTIRYYQLLFADKLGFKRVAEFTSYPGLFGIQLPDQVAEESFSVYDHPRVQIFKKTAAFNPDLVRQLLGQGIAWDSIIHLTPSEATAAPNGLLLSIDDRIDYQQTATWSSAEVNENSFGSHFPVLMWFLMLELLGLAALPITLVVFRRLADGGYIFSKALGLLLVSWGAWILASLRLAPFTRWAIIIIVVLLAIAAAILLRKRWPQIRRLVQTRWRLLLFEEALFWLFFAAMLVIRMHNPDLWHPALGGEKPMDLAYLTAIVRTPYFPSYDPWFAGGYINYYYFGFVLVATLIHLTGIMPYVAYNLAVPTFFALTGLGGFSVALGIAAGWQRRSAAQAKRGFGLRRATLLAGLCGALFVAVIGNLAQVKLIWDGVRGLSSLASDASGSPLLAVTQFSDGLDQWFAGHELPINTDWWYWNATRVIPKAEDEAGPINEFPFFTFLFADLHAHMMALPYTLLALALAFSIVAGSSRRVRDPAGLAWWRDRDEVLVLSLLALTTGALWPINTWDFPTYTFIAAAALMVREYARRGRVDWTGIWAVLWRMVLVVLAGWLLFLPFHQKYASSYFGAEIWSGTRTPMWAYLLIHGFFLFILSSYFIVELFAGHGHNALVRSFRLNLRHWRRLGRLRRLFNRLTRATMGFHIAVNLSRLVIALLVLVFLLDPVVGLALTLAALAGLLLFDAHGNPRRQFLLTIIGIGFLLTAVVEVIVLKGDISRMNTVFKFYLQTWVLWAVASAALLPELAVRFRSKHPRVQAPSIELPEGSAWTPEVAAQFARRRRVSDRSWERRWWWIFGILLAACFLYPLTATPMRVKDRFETSDSVTLDGTAFMRTSTYYDDSRPVVLDFDRQALEWLRQNVQGMPTVLEANTPLYRWGSRVSIYTGLPIVIGWDWHQKQQRSVIPGDVIDRRIQDVSTMYNSTDLQQTAELLNAYQVRYIYVGTLEHLYYDSVGLEKFDLPNNPWHLVYQNDQVRIYQVH